MVAAEVLEAAEEGDLDALKRFDNSILTGNVTDKLGCNCLHLAARKGGAELLRFLVVERGFNAQRRSNIGATAAHDAAAAGNLEALQWLLKNGGCSVNDQDGTGATVLHLACRFGHTHVAEWLLDVARADASMRTASNGLPLHFAIVGGDYDTVKLLIDEDPSTVNYQLSNGATATYLAAQEGHIEILRLLIQECRGNVKLKSFDGMSCVHAAAQSGHLNCVRFLVEEEKCNPNDRDFDGATPLHFAASQGHAHVIDWLMGKGRAKVMLDNLGGSPLHNAAECDQQECIKVLIGHGCSAEITDNNGLTASELARKCYNETCARLIETYQPQSQHPPDDDVAYLQSVQSPRQPPVIYTQQRVARQHNGLTYFEKPTGTRSGSGYQQQQLLNGYHGDRYKQTGSPRRSRSPNLGREGSRSPVEFPLPLLDSRPERPDTPGSVAATADSGEFPVGVPRNFSQDWSAIDGSPGQQSSGGSSSSLSSLSQGEDQVTATSQEVEAIKITQSASGSRKLNSLVVTTNQYSAKTKVEVLPSRQGINKNVTFDKAENIYDDAISGGHFVARMDTNSEDSRKPVPHVKELTPKPVVIQSLGGKTVDKKDKQPAENGTENGSVEFTVDARVSNPQTALQPARSYVANLEILKDIHPALNGDGSASHPQSLNSKPKTNITYINTKHAAPPPPPVETIPKSKPNDALSVKQNASVSDAPQLLGYGNQDYVNTFIGTPVAPPAPVLAVSQKSGNQPTLLALENENHSASTGFPPAPPPPPPPAANQSTDVVQGVVKQIALIGSPPTPPPPPAPPLPGNQQLQKPGNWTESRKTEVPSVPDDVKKKTVSLPARPTALFTPEMMMLQRSALTPAQARTAIENSADTEFIQELKMATKEPGLRRTSKSGESGMKPLMSFSAGQKTVVKENNASDNKDSKVELTGEWDPKNFVDQVPNKADLPAWKVQLQARHIAEKAMKETLEKRKADEHEARFKNMPAWKRALMEKKEAEAKAAEEKRQQEMREKEKQKAVHKKLPHVSVTAANAGEEKLAPWQRELQHR